MFVRFRPSIIFSLNLALCAACLDACHKDKSDKASPAEAASSASAIKKSLDGLKPMLDAQNTKFAALRKKVEALPWDMPGFGEVRAKFYSTEEGRAVMALKVDALSQRLDAAQKSGKREDLEKVAKDVHKTYEDMNQIDRISVELVHELVPFQRREAMTAAEKAATMFTHALPTGHELTAPKDGFEQHLIETVENPATKVDQASWLELDRVSFVGTSAEIDFLKSKEQIDELFEIIRAYPKLTLKFAGYSDSAAPATNKLAAERALAVKKALVQLGVPAARVEGKGGTERPVCDAKQTGDCERKSGRVAAHITTK